MDYIAIAGVGLGLTAISIVGGFIAFFSRSFLGAGRTLGSIETEVKATKINVAELKTTVKEGQERNDADHNKIFSTVNGQAVDIATQAKDISNIEKQLNGKQPARKRKTKKRKTE